MPAAATAAAVSVSVPVSAAGRTNASRPWRAAQLDVSRAEERATAAHETTGMYCTSKKQSAEPMVSVPAVDELAITSPTLKNRPGSE